MRVNRWIVVGGLLVACSEHQHTKPPELRLLGAHREPVSTLSADDDLFDNFHRYAGHYDATSATLTVDGLALKHDAFIRNITTSSFDLIYPGLAPEHIVVDDHNGLRDNDGTVTGYIEGSRWADDEKRWSALLMSAPLMARHDDQGRPRAAAPDAHVPGPPPPPPP